MATNSSEHLGLHLWEPTDQVLRTEFNENWQKLDAAAAGLREDLTQGLEEVTETLATGGRSLGLPGAHTPALGPMARITRPVSHSTFFRFWS